MPTITKAALHYIEDENEAKDARIDDLEEELEAALEENAALRARLQIMMSDRSMAV